MSRLSFTAHPAAVGETYFEHLRTASGFSIRLIGGGLAGFVHAVLPFLFTSTGSRVIATLHDRMVINRSRIKARPEVVSSSGASKVVQA